MRGRRAGDRRGYKDKIPRENRTEQLNEIQMQTAGESMETEGKTCPKIKK